jgi:histidine triad (HIT) family protein
MLRTVNECLFCRIASGDSPARLLFGDDDILVFHDITPQAPVHILVIPRRHISSLAATSADDRPLLGSLLVAAVEAARVCGVADGYRLVVNSGDAAGQSVPHLHVHVLGGRSFRWPPG